MVAHTTRVTAIPGETPVQLVARERAMARQPLTREQNILIDSCQGLVRSLAWRIRQKMGKLVELEDLIAYGQMGLIEAARKFEADRGLVFTTFAHYRIRGSILDGLEKLSWFKKSAFHGSHYEYMAADFLAAEHESGAAESDESWLVNTSRSLAVSCMLSDHAGGLAQVVEQGSSADPGVHLLNQETASLLRQAVDSLPEQVAQLIRWTYFEGMNLKQAGERLGIGKAWASRLHARALELLARRLRTMGYEHG